MSYQKILVTLDGSVLSELALTQIPHLVTPETVIHLLSVIDTDETARMMAMSEAMVASAALFPEQLTSPDFSQEVIERKTYLSRIAAQLEQAGYRVSWEVVEGGVVGIIVNRALHVCDLILMATHGRTGVNRLVFGSVAEKVLHRMPCPVMLVGPHHDKGSQGAG